MSPGAVGVAAGILAALIGAPLCRRLMRRVLPEFRARLNERLLFLGLGVPVVAFRLQSLAAAAVVVACAVLSIAACTLWRPERLFPRRWFSVAKVPSWSSGLLWVAIVSAASALSILFLNVLDLTH